MGEYATLFGHALRMRRTAVLAPEMRSYLRNIFPGLSTPSRDEERFRGCQFEFRTVSPEGVKQLEGEWRDQVCV